VASKPPVVHITVILLWLNPFNLLARLWQAVKHPLKWRQMPTSDVIIPSICLPVAP